MTTVGILGLGNMGSRMAQQFLQAGNDVVVWNRSSEKMDPLVEHGAAGAKSPADAARRADVLITMLADPTALAAVVEGPDGVAAADAAPLTFIEMSTMGPDPIARLAKSLPAEVELLDAPVLGSLSEVEAGELTIFAGGDDASIERWTPLLSTLGRVVHVGGLGSGAAAKLVANSTLFAVLTAVGEAVALGDGLGLARDKVFQILSATPLAAQAERRKQSIEDAAYPKRFALSLAEKDIGLVVDAAASRGLDMKIASAAGEWFSEANRAGMGDLDYSTILAHILRSRDLREE